MQMTRYGFPWIRQHVFGPNARGLKVALSGDRLWRATRFDIASHPLGKGHTTLDIHMLHVFYLHIPLQLKLLQDS